MTIAVCVALAVVIYLIVLNGFLLGARRAQIDAVLSILWVALLGTVWILQDWRFGLGSLLGSFIFARLMFPIAKWSAYRILR